jgi:hypothetical protein
MSTTEGNGSVRASGPNVSGPTSRTFPPGRKCTEPDCETVLSIYNETDFCGLHQPKPGSGTGLIRAKKLKEGV